VNTRARITKLEARAALHRARNRHATPEAQRELAEILAQMWYSTLAYDVDRAGVIQPRGRPRDCLCGVKHEEFLKRIVAHRGNVARAAESFELESEVTT
jgi:hypothetical protein